MIRPTDIRNLHVAFDSLQEHPLYGKYRERFRKLCLQLARRADGSAFDTFRHVLSELIRETNAGYTDPVVVGMTHAFVEEVRLLLARLPYTTWKRVWMYRDEKPEPRDMAVVCSTADLNHKYLVLVLVTVDEAAAITSSAITQHVTPGFMILQCVDRKLEGTI